MHKWGHPFANPPEVNRNSVLALHFATPYIADSSDYNSHSIRVSISVQKGPDMPPAARISDMHVCPLVNGLVPHVGGPVSVGMPTVLIGMMPAARVGDMCVCVGPPDPIAKGSPTVLIGNMMAARMGDLTSHGGSIVLGFPTVLIGEMGMGATGSAQGGAMSQAKSSGAPFVADCHAK